MGYFPFFVNVEELWGVIIGGGYIATEKVERLIPFQAKLTVIAPKISEDIQKYGDKIHMIWREYESSDLDHADYVIAATDINELNEQIYADAKQRRLLVNVADDPPKCDYIFPSVVQRGKLVVGVSSSGAGPQVAIRLRKEIEKIIPDNIEEVLDILAEERIKAKMEIPDASERRKYLIELADTYFNYEK